MKATFNQTFPEGAVLLHKAKVNGKPPMPEQTSFVQQWPFVEIRERIEEKTGIRLHPPGLNLYSKTGTGKSTAIYELIKRFWGKFPDRDYNTPGVVNLSGGQLWTLLVETSLGKSDEYDSMGALYDVLGGCKCFFLDELDKMNQSPGALKHFAEIIRRRHLEEYTYFFTTTNATPSTMLAKADRETRGPLRRRIIDMTVAVPFGDNDFRCDNKLSGLEAMLTDRAEREAIAKDAEQHEAEIESKRLAAEIAEHKEQDRLKQEAIEAHDADVAKIGEALKSGCLDGLPDALRAIAEQRLAGDGLARLWFALAKAEEERRAVGEADGLRDNLREELAVRNARSSLQKLRAKWGD